MADRYTAIVRFPSNALSIEEIAKAVDDDWPESEVDGELVTVTDYEAADGCMSEVTAVLDKFKVPYDHQKDDDIAVERTVEKVRYANGERTSLVCDLGDDARFELANSILDLMEKGEYGTVISKLNAILQSKPQVIEELSQGWHPEGTELFVIYSPNESASSSGRGFWNQQNGWVEFPYASSFSKSDMESLNLPISTGHDAKWVAREEAQASYG